MHKVTYLLGVALLAVPLFAALLVTNQASLPALAQETAAEATPAPEEEAEAEVEASEAVTDTMETPDPAVVAFQEAIASSEESLFVNLSTDELDRAAMAVNFSHKILKGKEIPVTIFLNVEGVRLVDKNIHASGESVQDKLVSFMADGGTVLICPFCMNNVGGMTQEDVVDGVMLGGPDMTWTALFAEGARVLSY
jgi:predicted peroxiredoxin